MILIPWYLFTLACMASFAIAWVLLSLLTSEKIKDLHTEIAHWNAAYTEQKMLADTYHDALHKQADKIHAEKLAEIEAASQKDDYIDWSKVPDGYDWVAVDSDNKIYSYHDDPDPTHDKYMWCISDNDRDSFYRSKRIASDAIIGPLPPWRESLRKRPGGVKK